MKSSSKALSPILTAALLGVLAVGLGRRHVDARTQDPTTSVDAAIGAFEIIRAESFGVFLLDTRTGETWSLDYDSPMQWIPIERAGSRTAPAEDEETSVVTEDDSATREARKLIEQLEAEMRRALSVEGVRPDHSKVRALEARLAEARRGLAREILR